MHFMFAIIVAVRAGVLEKPSAPRAVERPRTAADEWDLCALFCEEHFRVFKNVSEMSFGVSKNVFE